MKREEKAVQKGDSEPVCGVVQEIMIGFALNLSFQLPVTGVLFWNDFLIY